MDLQKHVVYQVTLPVSVELRSTPENTLLVAKHRTISYGLSERTVAQISRSAAASRQSYEAEMVDHVQRWLTTRIVRDGAGGRRFQECVRATRKHVWVRVVLDGQITYTRQAGTAAKAASF
jgi:hypothetical protein